MYDQSPSVPSDPDGGNELSTGELIKRILELEEQGQRDDSRITELEGAAVSDRLDIAGLRGQGDIDEHLIAELEEQAVIDRAEIAGLEVALSTARQIGAAVGIIMTAYKVTEDRAFNTLRIASQTTNRKLREIAEDVLMTGAVPPNSH